MFDFYLRNEFTFAALQLAFAMLGMGAKLSVRDFLAVFRQPRSFLIGMLVQLLAVPLIAVLVGKALGLTAGVTTGLILVAAVPGGTISNLVTYLARGNIALSIALTAVTTVACLLTTPLILELLAARSLPADFAMPTQRIAFDIALCLLAPLALGMLIHSRLPEIRDAVSTRSIQLSVFIIFLMIVGASGAGRVDPMQQGLSAILGLLALALAAQAVALLVTGAAGMPPRDGVAVAIEVTVRNTNLALMLKASLFPAIPGVPDPFGDGVLYIALMYGGLALPIVGPLVAIHRRRPPATQPAGGPTGIP
jgi:bile acid:Na+ symporter, BASS family